MEWTQTIYLPVLHLLGLALWPPLKEKCFITLIISTKVIMCSYDKSSTLCVWNMLQFQCNLFDWLHFLNIPCAPLAETGLQYFSTNMWLNHVLSTKPTDNWDLCTTIKTQISAWTQKLVDLQDSFEFRTLKAPDIWDFYFWFIILCVLLFCFGRLCSQCISTRALFVLIEKNL